MMNTLTEQYATDVTDVQWLMIEPLLPTRTWQPELAVGHSVQTAS